MNHLWKIRWWIIVAVVAFLAFSLPLMALEPVVVGVVHREDFAYAKMMRTAYEMALDLKPNRRLDSLMSALFF